VVEQPAATAFEPLHTKLHLRGVDEFSTKNVQEYLAEHLPADTKAKVEWIDDTSINVVFEDADITKQALRILSGINDETQSLPADLDLRPALWWSQKPGSTLSIRYATVTDKKIPRAAERSRYYLLNPDEDPATRRARKQAQRSGSDEEGEFRRKRYDGAEQRRRAERDHISGFDDSIYDESSSRQPRPRSRRGSISSTSSAERGDRRRSRRRPERSARGKELFGDDPRDSPRRRDRSASPNRDRDGDLEMNSRSDSRERRYRQRDYSSREPKAKGIELFPDSTSSSALKGQIELFPDKVDSSRVGSNRGREVLDNTTNPLSKRIELPGVDGSTNGKGRSLADRIGASTPASGQSLASRITSGTTDDGFSVRGATARNPGFSIKGSSKPSAVELFPEKLGSGPKAGQEIFDAGMSIKGRARRKAEDMFID
jgi:hypothetical protein